MVVLLYRDHLTTQINPAVEAAGEDPENNYNLTEPMFLQSPCSYRAHVLSQNMDVFKTEKKSDLLRFSLESL